MWLIVWKAFPLADRLESLSRGGRAGDRWVPRGAAESRTLPATVQLLEELITAVAALGARGIASWLFLFLFCKLLEQNQ